MWAVLLWGLSAPIVATAEDEAEPTALPRTEAAAQSAVAWPNFPPELRAALAAASPEIDPHTRWRDAAGQPLFTNRLILSDSPYLRQHAHNPVNWYPYGAAALAAAKSQNKLLFFSTGYASCHWCHVMAAQSFESAAVARVLNQSFIAVKIDRQADPVLDARLQLAVALTNEGRSGWPASVFALPDGRPIVARLYQPEAEFLQTLDTLRSAWQQQPDRLRTAATDLAEPMQAVLDQREASAPIDAALIQGTAEHLLAQMDPFQGGFGESVKFPEVERLNFLLDVLARGDLPAQQATALRSVLGTTLDRMANGGLQDPFAGGFFRYSTTPDWRTPHFEKMLYDQAMMARLYLKAGLVLGRAQDWTVADRTLAFVRAHMQAPEGGFVAAFSADSRVTHAADAPREEGAFYTWTPAQLAQALPAQDVALAQAYWQISPEGNFEGRSVPASISSAAAQILAAQHGVTPAELSARIQEIRRRLTAAQNQRPAPAVDGNRILAWNGLMIEALAEGGRLLQRPGYIQAAAQGAQWIDRAFAGRAGLAHSVNRGTASGRANLDDRANFGLGLLALYDATGESGWLAQAQAQAQAMEREFSAPDGGFYDHAPEPLSRPAPNPHAVNPLAAPSRPLDDDAEPAGNAQALRLLAGIAQRSDSMTATPTIDRSVAGLSGLVVRAAPAMTGVLSTIETARHGAVDALAYTAQGGIRLSLTRQTINTARVVAQFTPPWHANAHTASPQMIPTRIDAEPAGIGIAVRYPSGTRLRLAISDEPLNVYHGTATFALRWRTPSPQAVRVFMQPCSDAVCLAPAQTRLWLPPVFQAGEQ